MVHISQSNIEFIFRPGIGTKNYIVVFVVVVNQTMLVFCWLIFV